MRPTLCFMLIALCGAGCAADVKPGKTAPDRTSTVAGKRAAPVAGGMVEVVPDKPVQPAGVNLAFSQDIEGNGVTEEAARERALTNACERVTEYLAQTYNETDYKPSVELLRELKAVPPTGDIKVVDNPLPDFPTMKKATFQVRVSQESLKRLQDEARIQRIVQRQRGLGLGLAGFVALLLVAASYLRLEEATKGYYTGLLRFAALSLLAVTGGAIWYLS